ncbi:MAG TPA: YciI family protein [Longimicrobiales bacterium]|nr:YciI family protein [Longimicrobiales bacterium]
MTDFLLIYEGGDPNWAENRTPEEIQAVMEQWGVWFERLEKSGHLRSPGHPLAPGGAVLRSNGDRIETDRALPEVKELIGGYSVIAAESLDEAVDLAKGSPFLSNNPGGSVVVRPVLAMEA